MLHIIYNIIAKINNFTAKFNISVMLNMKIMKYNLLHIIITKERGLVWQN